MGKQLKNIQIKSTTKSNGITLIALVITIVVLLILAGVSIATLTGNNGILTQAGVAKETTENKSAEEKVKLAVVGAMANNKLGLTVDEFKKELNNYKGTVEGTEFPVTAIVDGKSFEVDSEGNVKLLNGKEEKKVEPGQYVSETKKNNYKDSENNTATVPAGFTVSEIEGEKNISTGLVIYDIPEDEIENVDWTTKNEDGAYNVQTLYNQFVWIPVASTEEYQRNFSYQNDFNSSSENTFTDTGYLPTDIQPKTDDATNNENVERTAVLKYNGFYIARYEAGNENSNVVSKQNITIYTDKNQTDFKTIGKTMYGESSSYVKSAMCSGIQWDMVMKFVNGKKDGNGNVYDVEISNSNRHRGNSVGVEKSGNNIADKVQNIYDLEGNCYEYVAEKNNTSNPFVYRGGPYFGNSYHRASLRSSYSGIAYSYFTIRPALYIE